ncbi:MAG: putative sugar O-methyltransferase [Planctomycetota bacterium]
MALPKRPLFGKKSNLGHGRFTLEGRAEIARDSCPQVVTGKNNRSGVRGGPYIVKGKYGSMIIARIKYYLAKLEAAWTSGNLVKRLSQKLKSLLYVSFTVLWKYVCLTPADKKLRVSAGFADTRQRRAPSRIPEDKRIFERIWAAYSAAKAAQTNAGKSYRIRGIWAEWIKVTYGPLLEVLTQRDFEGTISLLENFSREQFAVGTGASYDDLVRYKHSLLGRIYVKTVWCDYRDKLIDSGFDLSQISCPVVGNPAGIPLNGSTIQIETLRHAYNAFGIRNLLKNIELPVVVEIGGGFGGQAYQTVVQCRQSGLPVGKYLDFDIPEVQIVASYFLLKAFPEEKVCLFGEGELSDSFTIGVFPHFAIDNLPNSSADLVFNSHSFSEMDSESALHYLSVVNRVCRKYFMHINHEVPLRFLQPDGSISTNVVSSKMTPSPDHFSRVYKRPRPLERPEDKFFKSFAYLYERFRD